MALRSSWKAGEREDGAGGQGDGAAALASAPGVSSPISSTHDAFNSSSREKAGKIMLNAFASIL